MTPEGKVKILDFGLAKAIAGETPRPDLSTLTVLETEAGLIQGTPAYMSPQQARGEVVDKRTDIWAFGCVLYEMLTGRGPFRTGTVSDTLAAVLGRTPDWDALPANLPLQTRRLVERCLEKDSRNRLRDIGDARIELEAKPQPASEPGAPRRNGLWPVFTAILVFALVTAIGVWWTTGLSESVPLVVTRTTVTLPADQPLVRTPGAAPIALSPDGRRLVYVSGGSGTTQLYLRRLDQFDVTALPGTEGAQRPFFSPDGEWVGFFVDGLLQKVAIAGGLPLTICDAPVVGRGGSWGPEDTIIFQPGAGLPGLLRVSASGGEPEPLKSADPQMDSGSFAWPSFLPDGRALLTTLNYGTREPQIVVLSLESGEWQLVGDGGHARYAPPGYLVYYDETRGGLQAVGFDADRLEVIGSPVSVIDSVFRAPSMGAPFFEVSLTGSLVYLSGGLDRSLMWVDRRGQGSPATEERRGFRFPALSRDGTKVAVTIDPRPSELWLYDLERGTRVHLAGGTHQVQRGSSALTPLWSPDGSRLLFTAGGDLYWMPADGSSDAEAVLVNDHPKYAYSWSSDGRFLSYQEQHPTTGFDIWVMPLDGDRTPKPFLATPASEAHLRFSPDGRWVAYMSTESGRAEVYVRPFPGPGGAIPISPEGGRLPVWSADGRELFYRNGLTMMVVTLDPGASFKAGTPEILFDAAYNNINNNYDVSTDGRFLMVRPDPNATADRLQVVLNWFEELKRLAPADN